MAEGYSQRTINQLPPNAHLWLQAASVGEAYLACELIGKLKPIHGIKVLITSNTSQGIKLLKNQVNELVLNNQQINISVAFFPFDKPTIMKKAVSCIKPKVVVLLESEIWPGLLAELKKTNCKILLINGRMTEKSLSYFMKWPSFWRSLRPDHILAISKKDVERFKKIFGSSHINTMGNIKFDRISRNDKNEIKVESISKIIPPNNKFLILGSIRQEEEPLVEKMMIKILNEKSDTTIGLFPRHIHRIDHWKNQLDQLSLAWKLRSKISDKVKRGTIILWNTYGELDQAYYLANAAFIGGSLAPLGGQNFLEPLKYGIVPVIGPSWDNFSWAGKELIDQNLLIVAGDWEEAAQFLLDQLTFDQSKITVSKKAAAYFHKHQGGTLTAANLINRILNEKV